MIVYSFMVAERPAQLLEHMSPLELLISGIQCERDEIISLSSVHLEDSIVDEFHARQLGNSMSLQRGQINPIVVRAKEEDGGVVYDVIDGFHRTSGKKERGEESIKANVLYQCSDEEMYDLRILAASSVRSVQFPRIAEWMKRSFDTTAWAERGLTVTQAFGLVVSDRERTYQNLSPDELKELKEWVKAKCERWQKSVSATYLILRVVENSDPELVKQVRQSGGGKDRSGKITPARLQAVALTLPKEFEAQRRVLDYVVENRLSAAETEELARKIADNITSPEDLDDIDLFLRDLEEKSQHHAELAPTDEDLREIEGGNQAGAGQKLELWELLRLKCGYSDLEGLKEIKVL